MAGGRPSVTAWGKVELGPPLSGGARSRVFRARRGNTDLVVRVSGRPAAALDWELDLLDLLAGHGVAVPQVILTDDGRRHDHGVQVQKFIAGTGPRDAADWKRIVATLETVHAITGNCPQRPGFASARALLTRKVGGDVDLRAIPSGDVDLIRQAWVPVLDTSECGIHADLGTGNVLITDDHVALIDWDEARVDVPAFDYAHIPSDIDLPEYGADRSELLRAGIAWEAATCWSIEPEYAKRRLDQLRASG